MASPARALEGRARPKRTCPTLGHGFKRFSCRPSARGRFPPVQTGLRLGSHTRMNPVRTGSGDRGPGGKSCRGSRVCLESTRSWARVGTGDFALGEIVVPGSVAASRLVLPLVADCGSLPLWLSAGARLSRGISRRMQESGSRVRRVFEMPLTRLSIWCTMLCECRLKRPRILAIGSGGPGASAAKPHYRHG